MSDALAYFLTQRRREVEAEARGHEHAIAKLGDELANLKAAAKAAGLDHIFDGQPVEAPTIEKTVEEASKRSGKVASEKTIKEAVYEILLGREAGVSALDILPLLNERFGFSYPRTSLSPQLSRMKTDNWLERDGLAWKLTPAARLVGQYDGNLDLKVPDKTGGSSAKAVEPPFHRRF